MIVDRLFEINNDTIEELQLSEPSRQLTIIEENTVYYAAGYIMQKLIKKYRQRSDEQSLDIMGALLNKVGLDIIGDMPEDSSSYIRYGLIIMTEVVYGMYPMIHTDALLP